MIIYRILLTALLPSVLLTSFTGCANQSLSAPHDSLSPQVKLNKSTKQIVANSVFPETVIPNPITGDFLAGSFYDGTVYSVDLQGNTTPFIKDDNLITAMGLRVDEKRNRVYVLGSDIGVSTRSNAQTTKSQAILGIYSLSDGSRINLINLTESRPKDEPHFANDLTLDDKGNVYITDSLSPLIYKVDRNGNLSIFLESPDRLFGPGFNLNGIVYHPDGYLLVAKKNEGLLLKVPVENPEAFSTVSIPRDFQGADGLILINEKELVLIANRMPGYIHDSAFALHSLDNWKTASVTGIHQIKDDAYPTTGFVKHDKIFVVHSRLNRFIDPSLESPFGYPATIEQVGTVKR